MRILTLISLLLLAACETSDGAASLPDYQTTASNPTCLLFCDSTFVNDTENFSAGDKTLTQ